MDHLITCHLCGRRIENRDDLVTAHMIYVVVPLHSACYARAQKTWKTLILGNSPINSFSGNLLVTASVFLGLVVLSSGDIPGRFFLALLALVFPGARFYSWLAFERHLHP